MLMKVHAITMQGRICLDPLGHPGLGQIASWLTGPSCPRLLPMPRTLYLCETNCSISCSTLQGRDLPVRGPGAPAFVARPVSTGGQCFETALQP